MCAFDRMGSLSVSLRFVEFKALALKKVAHLESSSKQLALKKPARTELIRKSLATRRIVLALCFCLSSEVLSFDTEFETSARWRYQDVHDPVLGDTSANTALLRFTASSEWDSGLQAQIQFDHSFALNGPEYSDGVVLRNASLIPDPEVTEINQLWFNYEPQFGGSLRLGRQILSRDNERHIGGNGFWQNEQSFDGLEYRINLTDWKLSYAYIHQVNRIFGSDAGEFLKSNDIRVLNAMFDDQQRAIRPAIERGEHKHRSHLFDIEYTINDTNKIGAFWYALDNRTFIGFASHTFGLKLEGSIKPQQIKLDYRAEFAHQTDAFDSIWDYSAQYYSMSVGTQLKSHKLEIAYENIGNDNGFGFVHSLGSNHQFQGWADVFDQYRKPDGIADLSVTYRGRKNKLRWRAKLHSYRSANHAVNVGKEINLELAYRATKHWEISAVYAHYLAEEGFQTLNVSQQDRETWFVSVKYNL